jgi:hypothetical protein
VRYKQTAIGAIWAILRPFVAMVIFTVVFGRTATMPSQGILIQSWSSSRCYPGSFTPTRWQKPARVWSVILT